MIDHIKTPLSRNQQLLLISFWGLALGIDLVTKFSDLHNFSRFVYFIFEVKVAALFVLIFLNPRWTRVVFSLIFLYLLLRCTFFPSTYAGFTHQFYLRDAFEAIGFHVGVNQTIHWLIYSFFIFFLLKPSKSKAKIIR